MYVINLGLKRVCMRVLFVCHGNAYRSPLAEALLKKLRPDLEVDSAGLHVAIPISDKVRDYLRKRDAAQYLKAVPQSLDEKKLRNYDVIVVMDQKIENYILRKCLDCWKKTVTWTIKDPYFEEQNQERIFDEIENKVKELAGSL
jgi:protein-tyrosine-phosphatase